MTPMTMTMTMMTIIIIIPNTFLVPIKIVFKTTTTMKKTIK